MSAGVPSQNGVRKGCRDKVDFEAIWALAAKAGYVLAFEELVTRHETSIYRLVLNIAQNQKDAEDILQETFIKAHEHLHEFRVDSRFSAWLVQICIREVLQKFGESHVSGVGLDEPAGIQDDLRLDELADWVGCPEQRYAKTELNQILSEALSKISLIHRIVFLLHDVDNFSTVEIADLVGLSVPGTKSRLLRARLQLREYLNCYFSQGTLVDSQYGGQTEKKRVEDSRAMAKTAAA